jgi:hypothetical protein
MLKSFGEVAVGPICVVHWRFAEVWQQIRMHADGSLSMLGSVEAVCCVQNAVSGACLALRGEFLALLELRLQVSVSTVMLGHLYGCIQYEWWQCLLFFGSR